MDNPAGPTSPPPSGYNQTEVLMSGVRRSSGGVPLTRPIRIMPDGSVAMTLLDPPNSGINGNYVYVYGDIEQYVNGRVVTITRNGQRVM